MVKKWRFIFILGEVDCGYLVWVKEKLEEDRANLIKKAVTIYTEFLKENFASLPVYVLSVIPPVESDYSLIPPDKDQLRKKLDIPCEMKIEVTNLFNNFLKRKCAEIGVTFVDLDPILKDPITGLAKPEYKRESPWEWHLEYKKLSEAVVAALGDLEMN